MSTFTELEKRLGFSFNNKRLLCLAFTHRSVLNEKDTQVKLSNERVEFLGDSILSFLTSNFLYHQYKKLPEGRLTALRSALVRTETLASLAKKLDFGQYLILSHGEDESGGRQNPGILADTFEAFLGVLFLDKGLNACRQFLQKYLFIKADPILKNKAYEDYKSKLQKLVQEKKQPAPTYKVLKATGPDHNKQFTIGVFVKKQLIAKGLGKSKQKAEQDAARKALKYFKNNVNKL